MPLQRPLPSPRCLERRAISHFQTPAHTREFVSRLLWAPRLWSEPCEAKFSTRWRAWGFLSALPSEKGKGQECP